MRRYLITEAPVFLKSGMLELTDKQAARRKHALELIENNIYLIKSEVCFKVGEEIGFDGELSKALEVMMVDTEKPIEKPEKVKKLKNAD